LVNSLTLQWLLLLMLISYSSYKLFKLPEWIRFNPKRQPVVILLPSDILRTGSLVYCTEVLQWCNDHGSRHVTHWDVSLSSSNIIWPSSIDGYQGGFTVTQVWVSG